MQLPDLPQTERAIIEMTNAFRAEQKLGPVKPNAALAAAAKAFAGYLAQSGRFGHTVDGRQPADRTKAAGYRHCIVAENLAMNQYSLGFSTSELATEAVTGWKNSPPHRKAMLNPHVTEIGVGVVKGPDNAPKFLSVQLFGRPESFKYTIRVENRSTVNVRYVLEGDPVDVPRNSAVTETICTPTSVKFQAISGSFTASDGTLYRVTEAPSGTLQVEAVPRGFTPAAARSDKTP